VPDTAIVVNSRIALALGLAGEFRARLLRAEPETNMRQALLRCADRAYAALRAGVGDYAKRTRACT